MVELCILPHSMNEFGEKKNSDQPTQDDEGKRETAANGRRRARFLLPSLVPPNPDPPPWSHPSPSTLPLDSLPLPLLSSMSLYHNHLVSDRSNSKGKGSKRGEKAELDRLLDPSYSNPSSLARGSTDLGSTYIDAQGESHFFHLFRCVKGREELTSLFGECSRE